MPIRTTFVFSTGKNAVFDPKDVEDREEDEREGKEREGDIVFNCVQHLIC